KLGKIVALKLLPKDRDQNPEARARFDREMFAVGQLEHPNIVRALEAREIEGRLVLAMEFVEGLNLQQLLRRLGPLPIAEACELARQTAVALQFIHHRGLVHRDIKPSNLILTWAGPEVPQPTPSPQTGVRAFGGAIVKVVDLGLARLQEGFPNGKELTLEGRMMGTADYISPEQALNSRKADPRSDLYSLGCTLYALLAGRPPFAGPDYTGTMQKLTGHLRDRPKPIRQLRPDVPEALAEILDRLMAKNPADRFATAAQVAEALAPFTHGADLAALLQQAKMAAFSSPLSPSGRSSREVPTEPGVSSALVATDTPGPSAPSGPVSPVFLVEPAESTAQPGLRSWAGLWLRVKEFWRQPGIPYWVKVAGALAPVVLAMVLGVMITIRLRDGRQIAVNVPDGSLVEIDELEGGKPKLQVTVPSGEKGPKPSATPRQPPLPAEEKISPKPADSSVAGRPSDLVVSRPAPFTPEKPLRLLWQTELQRPWRQEVRRVRLTPDRRHLVVFHFTASPRCPLEWIDTANGQLQAERLLSFLGFLSVDGWVDQKGYLYVLGSHNRSFWKLSS
ncbi:MAG TPA: protein kinase, partial [Thermoguttaceae bacterium]|nr:protein kinase [Thermoguttaceae bacterium]